MLNVKRIINLVVERNHNAIYINKFGEIESERRLFKQHPIIDKNNNKVIVILIEEDYMHKNYNKIKKDVIKLTKEFKLISQTQNKWYTINIGKGGKYEMENI